MMKPVICLSIALLLIVVPFAMSVGPEDFLDGLVLYHPYDEGKGDKAEDFSENEHEGVIDNPKWVMENSGRHWNLAVQAATFLSQLRAPRN